MRKHNTLLGQAILPKKQFTRPKQVLTGGVLGNTGRGLSYQQYQGLVKGIDNLKDTTTVQRKEYDEYVDYNEKATVRSDYNIEDITRLAKSLEHIIDDLQEKWKVQQKWNDYFKLMISNASDPTNTNVLIDDRVAQLNQQIDQLRAEFSSSNSNDAYVELNLKLEESVRQVKNLLRVLQALPGIVAGIDSICNKTDGGFEIKYKTVKLKDIDLDAALPNEPDDSISDADSMPDESDGNDVNDAETTPGEDEIEEPIPEEGIDPFKESFTQVTLQSPADMKFSKLYADNTKLTDINTSLTETKTAIEQIKDAITQLSANNSPLGVIFSAEIQLFSTTHALVVNKACAISDLSFSITVEGYNLSLSVSSATTDFKIYGVSTNLIYTGNSANYNNQYKSGNGWGGLQVIHSRISGSSNKKYSIDMQQFAQKNDKNHSWQNEQWTNTGGITQFHVIAVGTIGTTSSSSSPTVNITPPTVPNTAEFVQSCGTSTSEDIIPEPEPEEEQ